MRNDDKFFQFILFVSLLEKKEEKFQGMKIQGHDDILAYLRIKKNREKKEITHRIHQIH